MDDKHNDNALRDVTPALGSSRKFSSSSHPAMRWFLMGAGAGLAGVFFLHPVAGARRRAMLLTGLARAAHVGDIFWLIGRMAGEIRHGGENIYSTAADAITKKLHRSYSDMLAQRVASAVHKHIPEALPVEVRVDNGVVTLRGPMVSDQIKSLIQMVESMPGVKQVIDQLQAQKSSNNQHLL